VTNGAPLRLEHPFNVCNHLIVTNAFPVVQLSQAFLNFGSEPFVVTEISFHYFLDKLIGCSTTLRCSAFEFSFKFGTKSNFHCNSLT
jgi:hypothetical protein